MAAPPTPTRPTVQLRHVLPDGSEHVDWMIAQDPAGHDRLITFRLPRRIDDLVEGETVIAEDIGLHRPAYLDYEGPVSGGRGEVTRLRRGDVVSWDREADRWVLEVVWPAVASQVPIRQNLRLERRSGRKWRVTAVARERPGD